VCIVKCSYRNLPLAKRVTGNGDLSAQWVDPFGNGETWDGLCSVNGFRS